MRMFIILLLIPFLSFCQYSGYYTIDQNVDLNANVNVNKNVNVSGYVNKTITSIDYGALASANAQKEANRINQEKLKI